MHNPVGKGVETFLDQDALQAVPAQISPDAQRSLTPRRVVGDEVLGIAPVIEQFFGAQRVEQRRHHRCIVTLLEQFTAQILGCMVAPRERVESRRPCRAGVEWLYPGAAQGVTPL